MGKDIRLTSNKTFEYITYERFFFLDGYPLDWNSLDGKILLFYIYIYID